MLFVIRYQIRDQVQNPVFGFGLKYLSIRPAAREMQTPDYQQISQKACLQNEASLLRNALFHSLLHFTPKIILRFMRKIELSLYLSIELLFSPT